MVCLLLLTEFFYVRILFTLALWYVTVQLHYATVRIDGNQQKSITGYKCRYLNLKMARFCEFVGYSELHSMHVTRKNYIRSDIVTAYGLAIKPKSCHS